MSCNDLQRSGGGGCKLKTQCLCENSSCPHKVSLCHPEEQRELRILPIMEDNKEHWSDSEHSRLSQSHKDERFRMTKKCHPELVSGSYQPSDSTPDWSDSEHTQSSPHPAPLPRRGNRRQFLSCGRGKQPYEQQRITDAGEGWQNQNHVNDNNKINCHPEETQCPKDLCVPKDSSVVLLPQNDDNSIKTSF